MNHIFEIVDNSIISKVFSCANDFLQKQNLFILNEQIRVFKNNITSTVLVEGVITICNFIVIFGALYFVFQSPDLSKELKGTLVLQSFSIMPRLFHLAFAVPAHINIYQSVCAALSVLNTKSESNALLELNSSNINSIVVSKLSFKYNDKVIFNNFNCKFNKGIYLIDSYSGRGKSTFLKILMGLIQDKVSGSIMINDQEVKNYNIIDYFAYCPQFCGIFHATVKDNITFLNDVDSKKLYDIAHKLCISDLLEKDTGINGSFLSGGEIQRINLARMLYSYKEGQVILLDEPFEGLNQELVQKVVQIIRSFTNNIVIINDHSGIINKVIESLNVIKI